MAVAVKNNKKKKSAIKRRQMPTKRVINLAVLDEKKVNFGLAIPAILLILVAAAVFSKFLVIDRMAEVSAAQAEVSRLQTRIDQGYEELAGFDDLADLYAHYTYSGFTPEELNRSDRVEVLRLIRSVVLPRAEVSSWSLSGNILTINLNAETLQDINLLIQQLESEDMVDFCTVNTANTKDNARRIETEELGAVKGRIIAYLNAGTEVDKG